MSSTGAVILAAGGSTRFGQPKQLLTLDGETLVRRAARVAWGAGCEPVIVIAGREVESIRQDLAGLKAELYQHPGWNCGLGSSVRAGVRRVLEITPAAHSILMMAADQPLAGSDLLANLMVTHRRLRCVAVASAYAGTIGVPALFDRTVFPELLALRDEEGAKALLLKLHEQIATVDFPEGAIDIDTPEDWEAFSKMKSGS